MSFGGSVLAAIKTLESNRKLKKRNNLFEKKKDWGNSSSNRKYTFIKGSPAEIAANRTRINEHILKEKKKNRIALIFSVGVTLLFFYVLFFQFSFWQFLETFFSAW